jgi:hypothetical protein
MKKEGGGQLVVLVLVELKNLNIVLCKLYSRTALKLLNVSALTL